MEVSLMQFVVAFVVIILGTTFTVFLANSIAGQDVQPAVTDLILVEMQAGTDNSTSLSKSPEVVNSEVILA